MAHPVPSGVDLEACLFGGQAFTWWKEGEVLHGIARGARVRIDPTMERWEAVPTMDEGFLASYLGEERTKPEALLEDEDLASLAEALPGLRLLAQDPWEALLAFLITPVNNVPRIQETIARLCRALGPNVGGAYAMPSPAHVANAGEETLRDLGLGFRAPRVLAAAKAVRDKRLHLEALRDAGLETARERLLALDGVGPKVAECVLCYALGFDEAFPVDRWVARASERVLGEALTPGQARDRWGDRSAMAQQLLFHGARMGLVEGIEASTVARFEGWRSLVGVVDDPRSVPP